eukprot:gnl/TRDRNA2_/TRDRNA2_126774_c2_seq1.p1 gnl/TRDRNA2_/TRDRNA2_126774_c2~~gnl/TRDRNA2_/TRDRNA2_126774_c2_seq1.p1  ORF type:complete len:370 (+),score=66.05 gnl/TRDRNA2_/TRDRNA2_126774_c2_seq1:83-1192(+)
MSTDAADEPDVKKRRIEPQAPTTFGDIMGSFRASEDLFRTLAKFTPLQRVAITANGNLQRLMSSYHNAPVTIGLVYNRKTSEGAYDRQVTLSVCGKQFGVATSSIELQRQDCIDAMENKGVAIGQLFNYFSILPRFELHGTGQQEDKFWREYSLSGKGVLFRIREDLNNDLFEMGVSGDADVCRRAGGEDIPSVKVTKGGGASLGDIMNPNLTSLTLPDEFTPVQRLLLTANGNVERIVSSFYALPVTTYVALNHRRDDGIYDRQVTLMLQGRQFMVAKSTVFFTDPSWEAQVEEQKVPLGAMFRTMDVLPTFTVHHIGRSSTCFWRVYTISSKGMTCEITETFRLDVLGDLSNDGTCTEKSVGSEYCV